MRIKKASETADKIRQNEYLYMKKGEDNLLY